MLFQQSEPGLAHPGVIYFWGTKLDRVVSAHAAGPSGQQAEEEPAAEPKLLAFTGTGRRLDGKPAAGGPPVAVTSNVGIRRPPSQNSHGKGRSLYGCRAL